MLCIALDTFYRAELEIRYIVLNKILFKISMIQLLVWKNVCLALRKILTLIALGVRLLLLKLGFLLKVYVRAFQSICSTYLLAKWYVTGQGKSCLFQFNVVNLFPQQARNLSSCGQFYDRGK